MEREVLIVKKKILDVLEKADSYCSLEYISLRANLDEPLIFLKKLEKEGYVCRSETSDWSASGYPRFKLSPKTSIKHLNRLI